MIIVSFVPLLIISFKILRPGALVSQSEKGLELTIVFGCWLEHQDIKCQQICMVIPGPGVGTSVLGMMRLWAKSARVSPLHLI